VCSMGNQANGHQAFTDEEGAPASTGIAAAATAFSASAVEIHVHKVDGEKLTARVIPGRTTGQEIGVQLGLAAQDSGEWFLASATGDRLGMKDSARVTQKMIDESTEGRWSLVRVGIQIHILAGPEKRNVEDYDPDAPTALIIPGTHLKTTLIPKLMRKGAEMGEYVDHDMGEGKPPGQGNWAPAHQIRLYNDITWPGHNNIVCVAVANFPYPRAYSEYPDDVKPFTRANLQEYIGKYQLAMEVVSQNCTNSFDQFATVPMGTLGPHIQDGDHEFLLSRLVQGLREHLSRTVPVKNLDFLVYEDKWVEAVAHGSDKVIRD